jgi:hypothetical protein
MQSSTRYPALLSPVFDLDFAKSIGLGTTTFGNMEAKMQYGIVLKLLDQPIASHALDEKTEVLLILPIYHTTI